MARTPRRTCRCRSTSVDRKSTRLNSSHSQISYAVFCLKKKKTFDTHSAPEQDLLAPTTYVFGCAADLPLAWLASQQLVASVPCQLRYRLCILRGHDVNL